MKLMKKNVFNTYEEISRAAAEIVIVAIKEKPDLILGLPTGSTPIGMYDALAKAYKEGRVDFSRVVTFNLDEYAGLTPEHPQSYRYFMNKHLFSRINIKPQNTHVPSGTAAGLDAAARAYDQAIEKSGGIDLFVVGIGQNGHIGFNEPAASMPAGTHVVTLTQNTIEANSRLFDDISEVPRQAVTQGMATILKAKKIMLLSSGEIKRAALDKMFSGIITLDCPATLLNLHGDVTVLLS